MTANVAAPGADGRLSAAVKAVAAALAEHLTGSRPQPWSCARIASGDALSPGCCEMW